MYCTGALFIVKNLQVALFKKYAHYLKGKVLDIGCGSKPYRKYLLAVHEYVGMDENREVKPDVLGAAQNIAFSGEYFDSVICTEVLEHLPEPQIAIQEIRRVLKNGGFLYLTVPQEWSLHYEPNDFYRFTKFGIKYLLEKNEFEIIALERIGGIFSLLGQRIIDVFWQFTVDCFRPILGAKWAERIASILWLIVSLLFYFLGKVADKIDKREAIGWAVLAKK